VASLSPLRESNLHAHIRKYIVCMSYKHTHINIHTYIHTYIQARRITSSSSDSSDNETCAKPRRSSHHHSASHHHNHHLGGPANRSSMGHRSNRHNNNTSHDVSMDMNHASVVKASSPPHHHQQQQQHRGVTSSSRGGYVGKGEWKGSNSPSPDKVPMGARGVSALMERWGSPGSKDIKTRAEKSRHVNNSSHSTDNTLSPQESPKDGSMAVRNRAPFDRHVARDIVSPTRPQHAMYAHNHPAQGALSPQNLTAKYGQRSPPLADGRRVIKDENTNANVRAHRELPNAHAQREVVQRSAENVVAAPPRHVVRELSLTPSASSHNNNHNATSNTGAAQLSPRTVSQGVRAGAQDSVRVKENKVAEELDGFVKGLTVRWHVCMCTYACVDVLK
jgi:hypothetical protein